MMSSNSTSRTDIWKWLALLIIAGCDIGCTCGGGKDRIKEYESVMILYSDGYNDLMSYLKEDIFDLTKGWVPDKQSDKAIVVISSLAAARGNYSTPTKPSMLQIYKNKGQVQVDTLRYYSETMKLSDPDDMKIILNDLDELFKAKHYGAVMSSHASGWVPEGYYRNPDAFESGNTYMMRRASADFERERLEYPDDPAVKSFGGTYRKEESEVVAYEIDLPELAHQCFPFHLDYLIFDACLMGGVEVAYELKDLADYVVFSQAEILADGLDYVKLSSRLLEGDSPDVVAVADDFFEQYQNKTDLYPDKIVYHVVYLSKLLKKIHKIPPNVKCYLYCNIFWLILQEKFYNYLLCNFFYLLLEIYG